MLSLAVMSPMLWILIYLILRRSLWSSESSATGTVRFLTLRRGLVGPKLRLVLSFSLMTRRVPPTLKLWRANPPSPQALARQREEALTWRPIIPLISETTSKYSLSPGEIGSQARTAVRLLIPVTLTPEPMF